MKIQFVQSVEPEFSKLKFIIYYQLIMDFFNLPVMFFGMIIVMFCSFKVAKCCLDTPHNHQRNRRIMPPNNNQELIFIRIDKKTIFKPIEPPKGECIICLDYYDNELECCSLKCEHTFHTKCIEVWFDEKQSCPLCRKSIL